MLHVQSKVVFGQDADAEISVTDNNLIFQYNSKVVRSISLDNSIRNETTFSVDYRFADSIYERQSRQMDHTIKVVFINNLRFPNIYVKPDTIYTFVLSQVFIDSLNILLFRTTEGAVIDCIESFTGNSIQMRVPDNIDRFQYYAPSISAAPTGSIIVERSP